MKDHSLLRRCWAGDLTMMEYLVDIEESNREVPLDGLVISDVV